MGTTGGLVMYSVLWLLIRFGKTLVWCVTIPLAAPAYFVFWFLGWLYEVLDKGEHWVNKSNLRKKLEL